MKITTFIIGYKLNINDPIISLIPLTLLILLSGLNNLSDLITAKLAPPKRFHKPAITTMKSI